MYYVLFTFSFLINFSCSIYPILHSEISLAIHTIHYIFYFLTASELINECVAVMKLMRIRFWIVPRVLNIISFISLVACDAAGFYCLTTEADAIHHTIFNFLGNLFSILVVINVAITLSFFSFFHFSIIGIASNVYKHCMLTSSFILWIVVYIEFAYIVWNLATFDGLFNFIFQHVDYVSNLWYSYYVTMINAGCDETTVYIMILSVFLTKMINSTIEKDDKEEHEINISLYDDSISNNAV